MIFDSRHVLAVWVAAAVLAACAPNGSAPVSNGNTDAARPTAAVPTVDSLLALDRQARPAHFQGDGMSFEDILNDRLLMQRGGSRLGKADVVKIISGVKCDVEDGWSLTEPQMSKIDDTRMP